MNDDEKSALYTCQMTPGYSVSIEELHAKIDSLHVKIDTVVTAVEGALEGLQNNPMLRAFTGGK